MGSRFSNFRIVPEERFVFASEIKELQYPKTLLCNNLAQCVPPERFLKNN